MITETNFQMLRQLNKEFVPKRKGIVDMDEIYFIDKNLHLNERNILDLRNLRDFTVMYFSSLMKNYEYDFKASLSLSDKRSAIVSVIDNKIFNKGGEV